MRGLAVGLVLATAIGCAPGPEVASATLPSNAPIELEWAQVDERRCAVWLRFEDVRYDEDFAIEGELEVRSDGATRHRFTLDFRSDQNRSPVRERSITERRGFVSHPGYLTGDVLAFPIEPQRNHATVHVRGALRGPSIRSGRVRLRVTED